MMSRRWLSRAVIAALTLLQSSIASARGIREAPPPDRDGLDPVAARARTILDRYMDAIYPQGQSAPTSAIGSSQAYTSFVLNRSQAIVADTNRGLAAFLKPFVDERYWLATKGNDERLYWHQTLLIKILVDARTSALLSAENAAMIKVLLWNFLVGFAAQDVQFGLGAANDASISRIQGSDNHDVIRHGFFLFSSQILKDDPDYARRPLPGGSSVAAAYDRWTRNLKAYFPEKASMGLVAEIASPDYVGVYLQSIIVIAQHAADAEIRDFAGRFLDLVFADAAQETLNGVRGGARSRAYKVAGNYDGNEDRMIMPLFVLTGVPDSGPLDPLRPAHIPERDCFAILTSPYRLPPPILELFLHRAEMGSFQYDTERPATGTMQTVTLQESAFPIYSPDPHSYEVRSSWVTPDYILGWFTIDESRPSLLVHDQNEQIGAITSLNTGRLTITGMPSSPDHRTSYGDFQAVGSKGTALIRLGIHAQRRDRLRLYLSPDFTLRKENGFLVALTGDHRSWFALKSVRGTGSMTEEVPLLEADWSSEVPGGKLTGHFFLVEVDTVLIVVAAGASTGTFDRFVAALRSSPPAISNPSGVTFTSPIDNSRLTLPHGAERPSVNGQPVRLPPRAVFASPYLMADESRRQFTVRAPSGASEIIRFS